MRYFTAVAIAFGLLAWRSSASAQSWGDSARPAPPPIAYGTAAPLAGYSASAPVSPVGPQTTFDGRQQSVLILDDPSALSRPTGGVVPASAQFTGAVQPLGAASPIAASQPMLGPLASLPTAPIYQPGQQFQLLDAPRTPAVGSPVAYTTIDQSVVPPGAVVPEDRLVPLGYDWNCCEPWQWILLPPGIIYHSYLAGPKEPRLGGELFGEPGGDTFLDGTLGARVGVLRYGNSADFRPQGWQVDVEGAAFVRQNLTEDSDVAGADFRIGVPVTYGWDRYQMKLAWYHTSAHLGDEFWIKNPTFVRINYSRNALVWGHSYYPIDDLRIYGEVEYAYFVDGGSKPWMLQFGFEYSPLVRGFHGAPFLAVNAYLRQENDWGGPLTVQTGWQWRPLRGGQLMRVGFHYQTGPSIFGQFFRDSEQQIGVGIWYDF